MICWRKVVAGAVQGVMAWTAYAAVECCFLSILPRLWQKSFSVTPPEWRQAALFLAVYPIVGLLLGGLSGLALELAARRMQALRDRDPTRLLSAAALFTLIWALAINMAVLSPPGLSAWIRLAVAILLSAALAWSGSRGGQLGFLLNPWSLSLLLLGLPWITNDLLVHSSTLTRAGASLIYLLAVCLAGRLLRRAPEESGSRTPESRPVFPWKSLVRLAGVVAIVLGAAYYLENWPVLLAFSPGQATADVSRPNVILITLDTVRADHLSVYGYKRDTTPILRKFAQEATFFSQAIAPSDITLSSHASLFTGLYTRRHGAHVSEPGGHSQISGGSPLADKFHTLAEILSENGYRTMGVVANSAYLVRELGLPQGFTYYFVARTPLLPATFPPFTLMEGFRRISWDLSKPDSERNSPFRRAEDINRRVYPLLAQAGQAPAPFFLFINYMDAHEPQLPPPPFDTLFPGKEDNASPTSRGELTRDVNQLVTKITEREKADLFSQYDGGIAYLDFHLGNLFRRLKELHLYENSLIIITSDHGQALGDRDLLGHGGISVYQDLVHIPLLIRYPHTGPKVVVEEPVSLVDILPTVLDVLGLEIPRGIDGQSLRQLASGGPRFVISECFPGLKLLNLHPRFNRVERALVAGYWKFVHSTAGKRELYDLSKDPDETRNLYSAGDGVSRELEARLDQWLDTVHAESGGPSNLNKETLERLRSLGYIQ
ncbi:MAG: sulfatase [Acidobacteria bacterium]|nr:sulfatase [Acidobacteriota bacterium]